MRQFTFIFLVFILFIFTACNNKISSISSKNSSPSYVSNFNLKCHFQNVGAYDYDLNQWRTDFPPYQAVTTIVINIGYSGVGQIFIAQYGHEKLTYNVVKSFSMGSYYSFIWKSGIGEEIEAILRIKKGRAYQFELRPSKYDSNSGLVYF